MNHDESHQTVGFCKYQRRFEWFMQDIYTTFGRLHLVLDTPVQSKSQFVVLPVEAEARSTEAGESPPECKCDRNKKKKRKKEKKKTNTSLAEWKMHKKEWSGPTSLSKVLCCICLRAFMIRTTQASTAKLRSSLTLFIS